VQSLELSTRECGRGQLLADMVRELADAHRALRRERPMVHEVVGGVWREVAPVRARAVDDICMDADRRQRFKDDVRTFLDSEAFYLQAGVAWTRGYLLHGPPGGGKTSLVQAVMSGYQLPGYLLALSSVATDEALTGLFRCLPSTPHVLVLEDVDCVGCALERREPREAPPVEAAEPAAAGPASPKPKPGVTLAGLLNAINGVLCSHGRLLFLTTNHRERLDAALVRAGRCDVHLEMGPVGAAQLRQLYERFFGEPPRKLAAALEAAWSDGLMPATVSATFLAHRDDGPAALRALASQRPLQV
jgi:chaperone BCS1